jgi:hypothetical protein
VEPGWSGAEWASAVGVSVDGGEVHSVQGEGEGEKGDQSVWKGLGIQWKDWHETIEDAVRDLERVAGTLAKSGWEELFGDDDEGPEPETEEDLEEYCSEGER